MGKAFSILRPPQPPQEGERKMELRKRPRPPRVDPDFVSSPPPLLLRKRVPAKRPQEEARQPPRKRARCAQGGAGSPVAWFRQVRCVRHAAPLPPRKPTRVSRPHRPFNWYEPDMWTEIAKHLFGNDLVCLSLTCRWFHRLLVDDSIWRYAFLRDLFLPVALALPPRQLHSSWRHLYGAAFDGFHSYCSRQRDKHLDWVRMGGFLLDTPYVLLTAKLPLTRWMPTDADSVRVPIEMMGACVLSNARPGIWIADMHLARCLRCNRNSCPGTMQVLDVRHSELFMEDAYWDGTLEYEDLGNHIVVEKVAAAFCGLFNGMHLGSSSAAYVINTKCWIGKRGDLQPRSHVAQYAVAINTNLQPNEGLFSRFQAMRDTTRDGQIVSIRISQQIL